MRNTSELNNLHPNVPEWFMKSLEEVIQSSVNVPSVPNHSVLSGVISWVLTPITSFVAENTKQQSIERESAVSVSIAEAATFEIVNTVLKSLLPYKLVTSSIPIALIEWLNVRGYVRAIQQVFNLCKQSKLADANVYNRMLKQCYLSGDKVKIINLFEEAAISGCVNEATYLMLLQSAAQCKDNDWLKQLCFDASLNYGDNEIVYITMIKCVAQLQDKNWLRDLYFDATLQFGDSQALYVAMLKCVADLQDPEWLKQLYFDALLQFGGTETLYVTILKCVTQIRDKTWLKEMYSDALCECVNRDALYITMLECVTQIVDKDWLREIYIDALSECSNRETLYLTILKCVTQFRDKAWLTELFNDALMDGFENQKLYSEIFNSAYHLKDKQWLTSLFEDAELKGLATQHMHSVMQKLEMNEHFKLTPPKIEVRKVSAVQPSSTIKSKDKKNVSQYCKFFQQGKCNRGDACRYVHNVEAVRPK